MQRATSNMVALHRQRCGEQLQEVEKLVDRKTCLVQNPAERTSTQPSVVGDDDDDRRQITARFSSKYHVAATLTPEDEADLLEHRP